MMPPKKKEEAVKSCECSCKAQISLLSDLFEEMIGRVESLEKKVFRAKFDGPSINKLETYNGEVHEDMVVADSRQRYTDEETIENIRNILKIMPPNLVDKDGKQSYANIRALGGPHLTDEIIDRAYEGLNLEP